MAQRDQRWTLRPPRPAPSHAQRLQPLAASATSCRSTCAARRAAAEASAATRPPSKRALPTLSKPKALNNSSCTFQWDAARSSPRRAALCSSRAPALLPRTSIPDSSPSQPATTRQARDTAVDLVWWDPGWAHGGAPHHPWPSGSARALLDVGQGVAAQCRKLFLIHISSPRDRPKPRLPSSA